MACRVDGVSRRWRAGGLASRTRKGKNRDRHRKLTSFSAASNFRSSSFTPACTGKSPKAVTLQYCLRPKPSIEANSPTNTGAGKTAKVTVSRNKPFSTAACTPASSSSSNSRRISMATVPSNVKKTSEGFVDSSTSRSLQSSSRICACGARKPKPLVRSARTSAGVNRPTGPGATAGSCASFQSRSQLRPVLNDKYSAPAENLAPRGLSQVQSSHDSSSSGSSSAASRPVWTSTSELGYSTPSSR